jgi:hypothetical protein
VRAGRSASLIKVKSHRGKPIDERADTLAEEGREIPLTRDGTTEQIAGRLRCGKGTRRYAQCGRMAADVDITDQKSPATRQCFVPIRPYIFYLCGCLLTLTCRNGYARVATP